MSSVPQEPKKKKVPTGASSSSAASSSGTSGKKRAITNAAESEVQPSKKTAISTSAKEPEVVATDAKITTIIQKFYTDPKFELEVRIGIDTESGKSKLDYTNFGRIFKYLNQYYKSAELFPSIELDIIAKYELQDYRITIIGQEYIDLFSSNENMETDIIPKDYKRIIKKTVDENSIIVNPDYEYKIKLSKEEPIGQDIPLSNVKFIRFKKRYSFFRQMQSSEEISPFKLDLTIVKNYTGDMNEIATTYEFELELLHTNTRLRLSDASEFNSILDEFIILFQDTGFKYSVVQLDRVKNEIMSVSPKSKGYKDVIFMGAKPSSFTLENVSAFDPINGKYSVTVKADGERFLFFISNNELFLVNSNFNVFPLEIQIDQSSSNMNGSILDGEYVRRVNQFLIFDIFFYGSKDVRGLNLYNGKSETESRYKYMSRFMEFFSSATTKKKSSSHATELPFSIRIKKYIFYDEYDSNLDFYNDSMKILNTSYDYGTDGLIFTPCFMSYPLYGGTFKETIKWKPESENTIDFLVEFTEQRKTVANVTYVIAQLYVSGPNNEKMPFRPDISNSKYTATDVQYMYIPIIHQRMKSKDGIDIRDKTIIECCWADLVEFYKPNIASAIFTNGWCPYRQRIDKTAKYYDTGKIQGTANFVRVANDIWDSILNPVSLKSVFNVEDNAEDIQKPRFQKLNPNYNILELILGTIRTNMCVEYLGKSLLDFSENPIAFNFDLKLFLTKLKILKYMNIISPDYKIEFENLKEKLSDTYSNSKYLISKFKISENALFENVGEPIKKNWDELNNVAFSTFEQYYKNIYQEMQQENVFATSFLSIGNYFKTKDHLYMTLWNISNALKIGSEWIIFFLNGNKVEKLLEREKKYIFKVNHEPFYEMLKRYSSVPDKFGKMILVKKGDSNEYNTEYLFYPEELYTLLNSFGFSDPISIDIFQLITTGNQDKPQASQSNEFFTESLESGFELSTFLKRTVNSDFKKFIGLLDAVKVTKVRDIKATNSVKLNERNGKVILTPTESMVDDSGEYSTSKTTQSSSVQQSVSAEYVTPDRFTTSEAPSIDASTTATTSTGYASTTATTSSTFDNQQSSSKESTFSYATEQSMEINEPPKKEQVKTRKPRKPREPKNPK